MGALTEVEIFSCLEENFRLAAQYCDDLAKLPKKGPTYKNLREALKLLEGAARQAAYWRQDARWLQIGLMMGEAHKRAGHWLRKHYPSPLFKKLAQNLRMGQRAADRLRTARTGCIGTILPKTGNDPNYQKSKFPVLLPPVQKANVTPGGIILPAGMSVQ